MELRGRVALVTGAGRRLGRELARALAGRGMALAIHHHASSEGAESLRAEVTAAGGLAECFPADLTDADARVRHWLQREDPTLRFTLAMLAELAAQKSLDYPTV